MTRKITFMTMIMVLTVIFSAQAGRLMSRVGKVHLEHLNIGQSYVSEELGGFTLELFNDSQKDYSIKVGVVIPKEGELEEGYEALPDASWVQFEQEEWQVKAQSWAKIPFILTVPDNEELLGKNFQVYLYPRTVGNQSGIMGLQLGLKTKLFLSISSDRPEGEKNILKGDINFLTEPEVLWFDEVKMGKKYTEQDSREGYLSIKNQSDRKFTYIIESIPSEEVMLDFAKTGYEPLADASWVIVGEKEFALHPGEQKDVEFTLEIPENEEFKGKKYMSILKVSQEDAAKYVRIQIEEVK